jgi:hypothetical protein
VVVIFISYEENKNKTGDLFRVCDYRGEVAKGQGKHGIS